MSAKGTPWFKVHSNIATHPKTERLADELGIPVPLALGHVMALLCWITNHEPDGDISAYRPEYIERQAMWGGERGRFYDALRQVGWLTDDGNGASIHNWMEYAGGYKRALAAASRRAQQREHAHNDTVAPQRNTTPSDHSVVPRRSTTAWYHDVDTRRGATTSDHSVVPRRDTTPQNGTLEKTEKAAPQLENPSETSEPFPSRGTTAWYHGMVPQRGSTTWYGEERRREEEYEKEISSSLSSSSSTAFFAHQTSVDPQGGNGPEILPMAMPRDPEPEALSCLGTDLRTTKDVLAFSASVGWGPRMSMQAQGRIERLLPITRAEAVKAHTLAMSQRRPGYGTDNMLGFWGLKIAALRQEAALPEPMTAHAARKRLAEIDAVEHALASVDKATP